MQQKRVKQPEAISESSGGVVEGARGVHFTQECGSGLGVLGHNGLCVTADQQEKRVLVKKR